MPIGNNILMGAAAQAGADLGETISQSLRLRGTQCLHHTFSRSSTGNTATLSFWVKISKLDREHCFIINRNGSHRFVNVRAGNDWVYNPAGGNFTQYDSRLVRDPSAWYHVLVIQNNGSTSLYINGSQVGSSTNFVSGFWNSTGNNQIVIGAENDSGGGSTSVCYFAEYNLLDGTAIGVTNGVPDEFGRFNADGVWVPKDISGLTSDQYGADGFRLVFSNSAGLGNDSAPTGGNHASANNFTTVGFETTALGNSNFDNDIDYKDTPTSNYATLNAATGSDKTLSKANLTFAAGGSGPWWGVSSTLAVSSGKWYWEAEATGTENFIGIIREGANPNVNAYPGQGSSPGDSAHAINGWGLYDNNGSVYHGTDATSYGTSWSAGDVIGIAMDLENNAFWVSKNGTWFNSATQAQIEAGTTSNAAATNLTGTNFQAAFHGADSSSNGWNVNLGQRDFIYTKPSGFEALDSNKLPEPKIKNGKDHFGILTYEGSGNSQTISGLEFKPDFAWIKSTSNATNHALFDVQRGVGRLQADTSSTELTTADGFDSFATTGLNLDGNGSGGDVNTDERDYVAWCWKAGGAASSNSNGDITSSVSANTTAGFSIVTWTGNGSGNAATVGHGLTAIPEFILVKRRTSSNQSWAVYHKELGNTMSMFLNETDTKSSPGSNYWGNTTPTNQVFTLGSNYNPNPAANYVAYAWHSVEGFSKFGSYEGNNDSDGSFVYLGFKPALVIFKNIDATGHWILYDSTRNTGNPVNRRLLANLENDEGTGTTMYVDFLSNGFKHRNTDQDLNTSHTFVYMAWAENPFGGENVPPATAR